MKKKYPSARIIPRAVKVGDRVGSMWIIADGLKPGERVIAESVR
jgi:multidrug efflux pump subunit AcrA (membrane-fusion protein)